MIGIYKWTNILNNKIYIGQSTNVIRRKTEHLYTLRNNKHNNPYLQNEFNKYGEHNFKFEVIEECEEVELNAKEQYYINLYNTLNRKYGYNLKKNDGSTTRHSEETKRKMSLSHLGKSKSYETRLRMSKAFKGRKLSEQHKIKLSKNRKGKAMGEKNSQSIISDKKAEEILIFLLNNKCSIVEVANKFDVSYDVVYNLKENRSYKHILTSKRDLIQEQFDKYNKNKFDKEDKESLYYKIITMYENGESQLKISKILKCSRNTIRKILTENNMLIPR